MRNAPTGTILGSYLISPNQEEPDFLKSFKASRFDKGKARGQPLKLVLEKMGLNHLQMKIQIMRGLNRHNISNDEVPLLQYVPLLANSKLFKRY